MTGGVKRNGNALANACLWCHFSVDFGFPESQPCGGNDLRGLAALLGQAEMCVDRVGFERDAVYRSGGNAVAYGVAGGRGRSCCVVVDFASWGGGLVETALPALAVVDCACLSWRGLVVDHSAADSGRLDSESTANLARRIETVYRESEWRGAW